MPLTTPTISIDPRDTRHAWLYVRGRQYHHTTAGFIMRRSIRIATEGDASATDSDLDSNERVSESDSNERGSESDSEERASASGNDERTIATDSDERAMASDATDSDDSDAVDRVTLSDVSEMESEMDNEISAMRYAASVMRVTPRIAQLSDIAAYIKPDAGAATCMVCIADMPAGRQYEFACKHRAHVDDCIGGGIFEWLSLRGTCPMCRALVSPG